MKKSCHLSPDLCVRSLTFSAGVNADRDTIRLRMAIVNTGDLLHGTISLSMKQLMTHRGPTTLSLNSRKKSKMKNRNWVRHRFLCMAFNTHRASVWHSRSKMSPVNSLNTKISFRERFCRKQPHSRLFVSTILCSPTFSLNFCKNSSMEKLQ